MALFKAPSLNELAAGRVKPGAIRQDAIGRRVFRADEERAQEPLYLRQGGLPKPRGPETFTPVVQEAARRLRISPERAANAVGKVQGPSNSPGGLYGLSRAEYSLFSPETGGRRPNTPILQAIAGLRKLIQSGGL